MIYLKLFYEFFIVGLFSFGGAHASIPLMKDAAKHFEVITDEMFANYIAISESTPGPVAINLATFIGKDVGGLLGAIVATIAVVIPAFVIILIFAKYFKKYAQNENVSFVFSIIRPCVFGIIMAVGLYMLYEMRSVKTFIVAIMLILSIILYKKIFKKKLETVPVIIIGAIFGIAINYFM